MYQTDAPDCHACGALPAFQWSRLASADEAGRQKSEIARLQGRVLTDAEIAARYGPLRMAVTGCAEHGLGDGDEGAERRALLHDAACGGHGACACDADSPAGVRP